MTETTKTAYYECLPAMFAQTDWTGIVGPAGRGDLEALDLLARAYWYPLFRHARRKGANEQNAEDVVQKFFVHLLRIGTVLARADRKRGKFRSFLLTSFEHFRISEWRKQKIEATEVSWEEIVEAGGEASLLTVQGETHDAEFARDWAITLLNLALQRLEAEQVALGRGELFQHLKEHLAEGNDLAELSRRIGVKENTLKSDLRRLRKVHLPRLLAEEVRRTLCNPTEDEVQQELFFIKRCAAGNLMA